MAPRKRNAEQAKPVVPTAGARVTRSMSSRSKRNLVNYSVAPTQAIKKRKDEKTKTATTPKRKRGVTSSSKVDEGGKHQLKKEEAMEEVKSEKTVEKKSRVANGDVNKGRVNFTDSSSTSKKIIIERCTQCTRFRKCADLVKDGLEGHGISVVVNPGKPRRGCFEIRTAGGEIFISLLDMKRPFKSMMELNMDQVISDIINKIR